MQVADSLRFPRIKSLPYNEDPDFELLGSLQTPYQWGFERTPIGLLQPPIQYYRLTNSGSVPVSFHMDLSEVELLNANNYDFEILSVLDNQDSWEMLPGTCFTCFTCFTGAEVQILT